VRGRWVYLYRAVDKEGNTVDFRLSLKRDVAAAKAFFRKALRTQGRAPLHITLDGYAASHRAVREMPNENEVWKRVNHASSVSFTQFGMGTVRMFLPLPTRSTIAQRSSRRCRLSNVNSASSRRRSPQPSKMARMARSPFP